MPRSHQLGKLAEKRALNYLLQKGYRLRETNYRFRKAEVDLIMQQADILVCVEVKARTHLDFGHPASFISPNKIRLLGVAMDFYAQQLDEELEVRFDVVCITIKNQKWVIEHLENAFQILE